MEDNRYKVVILGESEIGKDELISSIINKSFFDPNSKISQFSQFVLKLYAFPMENLLN